MGPKLLRIMNGTADELPSLMAAVDRISSAKTPKAPVADVRVPTAASTERSGTSGGSPTAPVNHVQAAQVEMILLSSFQNPMLLADGTFAGSVMRPAHA